MNQSPHSIWQYKGLFVVAAALFALEALFVLSASIPWLLGRVNADDFYYYLVLAQNNAHGLGPSFDGMELTNGFHPLYLLLLTPLASLPIENPAFLIKASLLLLLVFHNGTGIVLGLGFGGLGRQDLGWLMGLTWLLNPWALAITLHGVEAPIATFLWAIIILMLYRLRQAQSVPTPAQTITLGMLLGLAIWARTDGLLLLGAVGLSELIRAGRPSPHQLAHLRAAVLIGLAALIVTLPWWLWNWQNFGMTMQVSGKAIFLNMHGFQWLNPTNVLVRTAFTTFIYIARFISYNLVAFLLLGFLLWKRRYLPDLKKPDSSVFTAVLIELDFAFIAITGLACWYAGVEWLIQNWYLLSTTLTLTIIIGVTLEKVLHSLNQYSLTQAATIIVVISLLFLGGTYTSTGFGYPRQEGGYHLAQWINQETEPDAVIGVWNSGIVGYFSDRPIINLDGVVNNSLYNYKIENQTVSIEGIMPYIRSRGITYLTDYEPINFPEPEKAGLTRIFESQQPPFQVFQVLPDSED